MKVSNDARIGLDKVIIETNDELDEEGCYGDVELEPSIDILSETMDTVIVEVSSNQAGWLVMRDTFYPGWIVKVNEKQEVLYVADSVFRAVQLDAGVNRVEFHYRPSSFFLGALISIAACGGLILYRFGRKGYVQ
ncbi:MAG: hypothetical protein Kow0088_06770 [Anaerolineales bacterium]